ncbi:hypothetical protein DIPPA_70119 [Diplonema papillatum]|nr:hypothetical protein DIPPA_70119 [Diplonema papillatum]
MGCCGSRDHRLLEAEVLENVGRHFLQASEDDFESPVPPVGTSGGTASFFKVKYKDGRQPFGKSKSYWIAKDLARASDEIEFYEQIARIKRLSEWPIFRYMLDYGGVAEMNCLVDGQVERREQILLRNLLDDVDKHRMLDIKIGAVTAVGGWHGKSHVRAMKNKVVDQATNSHVEGFRVEGFEGAPAGLEGLLEVSGLVPGKRSAVSRRLALQRLPASVFFQYFVRMPHEKVLQKCYSGTEVAALAVRQIVMHLLDIVSAAAATPVPQQWIGSSIALAFDAGKRPERNAHGGHPLVANVKIFDWGRSELASFDMFNVLSSNQQRSRASHWAQWIGGALRLSFEAARFYRRQYCPSGKKWTTVKFEVWSHTKNNDITTFLSTRTGMGVATIDLSSAPQNEEIELALLPPGVLRGATIIKTVGATVNTVKRIGLSVSRTQGLGPRQMSIRVRINGPLKYPAGSNLEERWEVHVISAHDLPKTDVVGWCNPVVTVSMIDGVGARAVQRTNIIRNTREPVWNEVLEFAIASDECQTSNSLLPHQLAQRASSDSITGWDLAAGSGGDFRAALRLWKALFFFAGQANTNNGLPHLGVDDQLEAMLFQSMKSFDDTTTAPTIIPTDSNSGTGSPRMRGHSGFSAVNDNIVKELAPEASEEHKCDQTRFSDNLAEKEVDTPPHTGDNDAPCIHTNEDGCVVSEIRIGTELRNLLSASSDDGNERELVSPHMRSVTSPEDFRDSSGKEVKRGDSPLVSVVSSAFGREPQVSSPLEDKLRETEILLEKELRRSSALQEEVETLKLNTSSSAFFTASTPPAKSPTSGRRAVVGSRYDRSPTTQPLSSGRGRGLDPLNTSIGFHHDAAQSPLSPFSKSVSLPSPYSIGRGRGSRSGSFVSSAPRSNSTFGTPVMNRHTEFYTT